MKNQFIRKNFSKLSIFIIIMELLMLAMIPIILLWQVEQPSAQVYHGKYEIPADRKETSTELKRLSSVTKKYPKYTAYCVFDDEGWLIYSGYVEDYENWDGKTLTYVFPQRFGKNARMIHFEIFNQLSVEKSWNFYLFKTFSNGVEKIKVYILEF